MDNSQGDPPWLVGFSPARGVSCIMGVSSGDMASHRPVPPTGANRLFEAGQTWKLEPHPHEEVAFGFWKTNPRAESSSRKSMVVPLR